MGVVAQVGEGVTGVREERPCDGRALDLRRAGARP